MLSVAMLGATGRMGRSIVPLIVESGDLRLSGALAAASDPAQGRDAGLLSSTVAAGVDVTSDAAKALEGANVAIDFTFAAASVEHARICRDRSCALVIGTTGHDAGQKAELAEIARSIPVVLAPNMSLGVNLLFKLAELAAKVLDDQYDAEVFEAHHRNKVDAPSGTALRLGEAVALGRGTTLEAAGVFTRHGVTGARERGTIGFSVLRGGDIVGDQT